MNRNENFLEKNTVLETEDPTAKPKLTQAKFELKLEEAIDKLLEEYNSDHEVHLDYNDVIMSIDHISGWKK